MDALTTREIVVPFGPALPQTQTYHLLIPPAAAKRKDLAVFRGEEMRRPQARRSAAPATARERGARRS